MSYVPQKKEKTSALSPFIGFVMLIVTGGLSFLLSPTAVKWLKTTHWEPGGTMAILPLKFPASWSPMTEQLVVSLGLFIMLFAIAMAFMFMFMKTTADEIDIKDLKEMQKQKKKRRGR